MLVLYLFGVVTAMILTPVWWTRMYRFHRRKPAGIVEYAWLIPFSLLSWIAVYFATKDMVSNDFYKGDRIVF